MFVTYFGNKEGWTFTAPLLNDSNIEGVKKYPNETITPISKFVVVWSGVGILFMRKKKDIKYLLLNHFEQIKNYLPTF